MLCFTVSLPDSWNRSSQSKRSGQIKVTVCHNELKTQRISGLKVEVKLQRPVEALWELKLQVIAQTCTVIQTFSHLANIIHIFFLFSHSV